ncbi:MAG: site-specific DNA-methyltransferase, partial [Phycisphaerales bacterium]|nr:site-specific DNA-methyltransferase [Phycisphaerales bacterium]
EKTKRHCVGIELSPRYVDVAITRWQLWTGREAVHEATGRTYNQLAKEASDD